MVVTASVIHIRSSSKLAERGDSKTLSLTSPYMEESRSVKTGDLGGQTIILPRPIQANTEQGLAGFKSGCPRVECHLAV